MGRALRESVGRAPHRSICVIIAIKMTTTHNAAQHKFTPGGNSFAISHDDNIPCNINSWQNECSPVGSLSEIVLITFEVIS